MPPTLDISFGSVAPYYDHLMAGVPYAYWVKYLERLWAHHDQTPRTILDLACGTGTVSRLLAQKKYAVVGVDLASAMLESAREKARDEELTIPFFQQDAAELDLPDRSFDAVVSLFDSLNYLLDADRLRSAFERIFLHLTPGGSLIFDVNTEYALAEGMFNQSCTRRDEPLHYRWRSRYDQETGICTVRMQFSHDNGSGERQSFVEVHRQRAYHKDDLVSWLQNAGFVHVFVYDAYSLDRPKKRSDRLFFVALKPK